MGLRSGFESREVLDKVLELARAKDWTIVDMAADWTIVFPFQRDTAGT